MERETELTQSWNPELAALNDKPGGLLNGIPLLVGGELKTFSLPVPLDDDGTDISLKDWQLGPREGRGKDASTAPYSIKPFRGSVRTRFTPIEEDLSSPRGQSSPDHFETPTTPRTPRASSSGSASPASSFLQEGDQTLMASLHNDASVTGSESNSSLKSATDHHTGGIAFDVTLDSANKSTRSLRVSFVDNAPQSKPIVPVVRHRSPLKSRSLHPPKQDAKALQPKWESSTKIRHPITPSTTTPKPQLHAPQHGMRRKSSTPRVQAVAPMPAHEIEVVDGSSGYLSDGRALGSDRLSLRRSNRYSKGDYGDHSSNRLSSHVSRDLTMSPVRAFGELPRSSSRKHGARYESEVDDDDEEDTRMPGVLCGGGISDTKLSGDFMRLLSKLCRVPVPKQAASASTTRGRSKPQLERSKTTSAMSWDASMTTTTTKESSSSVIGRRHSLQLLSEKCSNTPAPMYDALHKPRKIRTHEPHVHFYRTISKTLDQKLKS